MKVGIILLSILAAAAVWRWGPHRSASFSSNWRRRSRQVSQSLLAGVAVYVVVMSLAMLYLMLTHT